MNDAALRQTFAVGLRHRARTRLAAFVAAILLLLALGMASLCVGAFGVGPARVIRLVAAPLLHDASALASSPDYGVVWGLRLPRMLMGALAGAGLALAGAALQGLTRNVLVSPFTLGIAPAAAFGASLVILFAGGGRWAGGTYLTVFAAFLSAMSCAFLVLVLSSVRDLNATVLVLIGVALTQLFGALTAALQFIASEQQLAAIIHWTFGSLNGATWQGVATSAVVLGLAAPILCFQASALNAFAAGGDDVAAALGVAVSRVRWVVTAATVIITASIVSFAGVIGFVGLVSPHIARLVIGGDHRMLLPFAALMGAALVLAADLVGRVVLAPVLIPVGIVVAFIGVPIFIHLLLSRRNDWAA